MALARVPKIEDMPSVKQFFDKAEIKYFHKTMLHRMGKTTDEALEMDYDIRALAHRLQILRAKRRAFSKKEHNAEQACIDVSGNSRVPFLHIRDFGKFRSQYRLACIQRREMVKVFLRLCVVAFLASATFILALSPACSLFEFGKSSVPRAS